MKIKTFIYKNYLPTLFMLLCLTVFFLFTTSLVLSCGGWTTVDNMVDTINNNSGGTACNILNTDSDLFKTFVGTSSGGNTIDSMMKNFILACKLLALVLVIVEATTQIGESMNQNRPLDEVMIAWACKIGICLILIVVSEKLMGAVTQMGIYAIQTITNVALGSALGEATPSDALTCEDLTGIKNNSMIHGLQAYGALLVPWAASWACAVGASLAALSALFEIAIYRILAPFSIYNFLKESGTSQAMHYIKLFFAAFLKCCIILFLGKISASVTATVLQSTWIDGMTTKIILIIAANATIIALMMKGGEYSNKALGV